MAQPALLLNAAHERRRRQVTELDALRARQTPEAKRQQAGCERCRGHQGARQPGCVQSGKKQRGQQQRDDRGDQEGGETEAPADPDQEPGVERIHRQLGRVGDELERR